MIETDMATILRESVTEAPVKTGNLWRAIVARPGKGSSGTYSAEVLKRDAAKIVPAGAQSFITHDGDRDPRGMLGVFPEAARWDEDEQAIVAELKVFEHWKAWAEEVGPHCGISLFAMGEVDDNDNITAFVEDAYNGADLVARPGLEGSRLAAKLYEAALTASQTSTNTSVDEGKEIKDMDEVKELTAKVDALATAVETLVSAQNTKAEEAAQKVADDAAVAQAVEAYDAAVQAIEDAELFPEQVETLRAEAKKGVDITSRIAEAKTLKDAAVKHVTESATTESGRIMGTSSDWTPGAWA